MMHFTCDQCGREMLPDQEPRYEVTIACRAMHDPTALTEEDLDEDHIEALGEMLREIERGEEPPMLPPMKREFRYDLCPECHDRFLRDPLGKEQARKLHFSEN